jgi:nicotinate-nucleotide adenylyltransferase
VPPDATPHPPIAPIPVPAAAGRILIVGGTFDPPHRAHVTLPDAVRRALWAGDGWLLYIPAWHSPLKAEPPIAPGADRAEMLRLALAETERAAVWTDELDRGAVADSPSYTVRTLRRAREALGPTPEMRLLIGADQAADFHRWRDPREIIRLAEPVVMLRAPADSPEALVDRLRASGAWSDPELESWRRRIVPVPIDPASATEARALLRNRRNDRAALLRQLHPDVLRHILARGLYR